MKASAALLLTIAGLCMSTAAAEAQLASLPVSKCNAGKVRAAGKTAAALLACHGKDATAEASCLAKVDGKFDAAGTGPFDKADAQDQGCLPGTTGNQSSFGLTLDAFASAIDALLGVPTTPSKCDAARLRCVGKYVAGTLGCVAKTAGKLGGAVDSECLAKVSARFSDPMHPGCYDKATNACSNATTAATAKAEADQFIGGAACNLLPGATPCTPVCGNGFVEPGEPCDGVDVGTCGAEFACTACNCACPTSVRLVVDAAAAESVVDRGWRGLGHRAPVSSNAELTFGMTCGPSTRPCGTCTLSGPVANSGAGTLQNRRCAADTRVTCTGDGDCVVPGGTCELFFGTLEPVSGGGIGACITNQFAGGTTGTVDVESGGLAITTTIVQRIYSPITNDTPCPTCVGDGAANDGIPGGTCAGGTHHGESCDANGSVPNRPDFGATSFDCPQIAAALLSSESTANDYVTDTVTKTLSASNPICRGSVSSGIPAGSRCLCDTCNSIDAEPCSTNADCPDPAGPIGPICGGRRCIGGANAGAACTNNSECPSGGLCNRPGEPTIPSACFVDDSSFSPDFWVGCVDTAPIDGEGECDYGPLTEGCSVASGHGQRLCATDADCGGAPDSCELHHRACFLTGPFTNWPGGQGTGTLTAAGAPDAPVADAFAPTLGRVGCSGPSGSPALNNALGLPGPVREVRRSLATFHP